MKQAEAKVGKRVLLPANKKEKFPEERGVILEVNTTTVCVELFPRYIKEGDDGLREVSIRSLKLIR